MKIISVHILLRKTLPEFSQLFILKIDICMYNKI